MPGPFPLHPEPHPEDNWEEAETTDSINNVAYSECTLESGSELQPDQPASEGQITASPEAELPLEAQGETNGGPLGCCLGVTVGILLFLLLGVIGFGTLIGNLFAYTIHTDAITNTRIATAIFATIGAIIGGYFGWKIGKHLYRVYEPPVLKARSPRRKAAPKEAKLM